MKKFFLPAILLPLMGCSVEDQAMIDAYSHCPNIGLYIEHPDFSQPHKREDIDAFYQCMNTRLQPEESRVFGHYGTSGRKLLTAYSQGDEIKAEKRAMMQEQKKLWQQVLGQEKTPQEAQDEWLKWQQGRK